MIQAIIFDMDDLMINSHPVHIKLFGDVLQKYGADINDLTSEEEASLFGRKGTDVFSFFIQKFKLSDKITTEEMYAEFIQLALSTFEKHVEPMPGLFELLECVHDYKRALASSSKHQKINAVLKKLRLETFFDAIVSGGDDINHGKPAPDTFLKAAEKLGVKPENCLVLEDANSGVLAAKAAGMHCIGVHNKFCFERIGLKQDLSEADLEVNSLSEISLDYIKKL